MVYCRTHKRYHKGHYAKAACMMSVFNEIPYDVAFDKVKRDGYIKRDFNLIWTNFNAIKNEVELMMSMRIVKFREKRSQPEQLKTIKVATKAVVKAIREGKVTA